MKKNITCVTVAAIAMTFASCKKEYSCTCNSSVSGSALGTTNYNLGKQTKKDAESACKAMSTNTTTMGTTVIVDCKLN